MSKNLVEIAKAARILGVTPNTLRRWHQNGTLVPIVSEKRVRWYETIQIREMLTLDKGVFIGSGDIVKIREAAEFIGYSAQTLRKWHYAGKLIPYVHKLTKIRYYSKEKLLAYIENRNLENISKY